jgi:hypothetical protein
MDKELIDSDAKALFDVVGKALWRAWRLGQTYWQQTMSDSVSQRLTAEETQREFDALLRETCSKALALRTASVAQPDSTFDSDAFAEAMSELASFIFKCTRYECPSDGWKRTLDDFNTKWLGKVEKPDPAQAAVSWQWRAVDMREWCHCDKAHYERVKCNPEQWRGYEVRELCVVSAQPDPTQPTELEMLRAADEAIRAAGFDSPEELLAAYNVLVQKPDHAAALADALATVISALERDGDVWGICVRPSKTLTAYRASLSNKEPS